MKAGEKPWTSRQYWRRCQSLIPELKKPNSCSVNGSLLTAYKVTFVSLQSQGLTHCIGSVDLGGIFCLSVGFWRGNTVSWWWWWNSRSETFNCQFKGEANPIQLLGTGPVVASSHLCLLVPATAPDGCPRGLVLEEMSHMRTSPLRGLLCLFSEAEGPEYRWRCWKNAQANVLTAGQEQESWTRPVPRAVLFQPDKSRESRCAVQRVPKVPWPNHRIWEASTVLLAGETSQHIQWKKLLWVALQSRFFLSSSLLLSVLSSVGRTVLWLLAEEFSSCYCSWLGFMLRALTPGGCRVSLQLRLNVVKHESSHCSAAVTLCLLEITDCVTPHHPVQRSMSELAASSRCTNS